jgi:hypothetical protein
MTETKIVEKKHCQKKLIYRDSETTGALQKFRYRKKLPTKNE